MTEPVNYKHSREETITLAHDGDEISVWPSDEVPGSVDIALMDSDEPRVNVGIATPAEWDAFVAAGDRALGRKPVRDFPPGPLLRARPSTDAEIVAWMADLYREDTPIAEALGRAALAMVREAGPTVPRAAVEALRSELAAVAAEPLRTDRARAVILTVRSVVGRLGALLAPTTKEPDHADD